jgi:hypothetical protein
VPEKATPVVPSPNFTIFIVPPLIASSRTLTITSNLNALVVLVMFLRVMREKLSVPSLRVSHLLLRKLYDTSYHKPPTNCLCPASKESLDETVYMVARVERRLYSKENIANVAIPLSFDIGSGRLPHGNR